MATYQQSICPDWQIGLKSIGERVGKLLKTGERSDVVFLVGHDDRKQTIHAHKLILSIASPVFETMLFGSMADKQTQPIEIQDVSPQAFMSLLRYIYSDEIDLTTFDQVCEICYTAKKYMIPILVEECLKFIWKDLHPGNVCRAYAFVILFEESELLEKCISIIKARTLDVVTNPTFEETEMITLKKIVQQESLCIHESLLWEGIVRWSKQECLRQNLEVTSINQRTLLNDILPHIRFLTLTPQEFLKGPDSSNILTQEECYEILKNICTPGKSNMPPNFSTSRVGRMPVPQTSCNTEQQISAQNRVRRMYSPDYELEEPREQLFCNCAGLLCDTFVNDELVDCTLSFSVNRNISIVGVVLPTQLKPMDPRSMDMYRDSQLRERKLAFGNCCSINKYPELIYAFLTDSDGCRLTYTHFSARVQWENSMEVLFNKPINIFPNMKYKIVVVLNKVGRYPLYNTVSQIMVGDANFTFFENQQIRESIVKTLIFKSYPQSPMRESSLLTI